MCLLIARHKIFFFFFEIAVQGLSELPHNCSMTQNKMLMKIEVFIKLKCIFDFIFLKQRWHFSYSVMLSIDLFYY